MRGFSWRRCESVDWYRHRGIFILLMLPVCCGEAGLDTTGSLMSVFCFLFSPSQFLHCVVSTNGVNILLSSTLALHSSSSAPNLSLKLIKISLFIKYISLYKRSLFLKLTDTLNSNIWVVLFFFVLVLSDHLLSLPTNFLPFAVCLCTQPPLVHPSQAP